MKAVILAGGYGTRITEETINRPKPMIELGGMPILLHIMHIYSHYGINDFVICTGYKHTVVKDYFNNYYLYQSDVTFDFKANSTIIHQSTAQPWRVTLVNTGEHTMTGGRLKRIAPYVKDDEAFCMTYGDGVADINIKPLLKFHASHKLQATLTAVTPRARFGSLKLNRHHVEEFHEKPAGEGGYINGGFFVLSPKVIKLIKDDDTIWEREPLEALAAKKQLAAYKHPGFWQPMDTLRDKLYLEKLIEGGKADWIKWKI